MNTVMEDAVLTSNGNHAKSPNPLDMLSVAQDRDEFRRRSAELLDFAFRAHMPAVVRSLFKAGCEPRIWLDTLRHEGAEAERAARFFLAHGTVDIWLAAAVTGEDRLLREARHAGDLPAECLDHAMVVAAGNGQLETIKLLQELGADPHCMADMPFLAAAANDRLDVVRYLHTQLGESFAGVAGRAMTSAVSCGARSIVEYLHSMGAEIGHCAPLLPQLTLKRGNIPLLEYFAKHGIEWHAPYYAQLLHVLSEGHVEGVRQALSSLPVVDAYQALVMRCAGQSGCIDAVRLLSESGFDLVRFGQHAILAAASRGHLPFVRWCVEKGADVEGSRDAIMRAAFDSGNRELVEALHRLGYGVDAIDSDSLQAAVFDGRCEVLSYAVANGADMIADHRASITAMADAVEASPASYHPSAAWKFFHDVHMELLRRDGLYGFKKALIQSYFSAVPESWADPQLRSLLRNWLTAPSLKPLALRLMPDTAGHGLASSANRTRYRVLLSLLWTEALKRDRLGLAERVAEPCIGNPVPALFGDRFVSQDLAHSILECNAILENHVDTVRGERLRIAEIGAGYGRLGPLLVQELGCQYCVFDIAPALYISQWYLSTVLQGKKIFKHRSFESFEEIAAELADSDVAFFTSDQLAQFPEEWFDISVNISSLHEMQKAQIEVILGQMYRVTRESVYLKQYRSYKNPWDRICIESSDYPVPPEWETSMDRGVRVDGRFFERRISRRQPQERKLLTASPRKATVSVVLANFNHAHYLETSLWGICGQSRPADEVIVVDDGSWDDSRTVVEKFQRYFANIRFIARERNGGQHFAIQQAIREAHTDYVVWAASDDLMLPDFLEQSMQQAEKYPEAGLVFSRLCVWTDGVGGVSEYTERNHGAAFDLGSSPRSWSPVELRTLLQDHYLWISGNTVVCKRVALLEMGGFEADLRWHADWFGFYAVALRHGAVGIPATLAMMRERRDTFSLTGMSNPAAQARVLRAILKTITSPKYRDLLPVFKRCPSLLSLFGHVMSRRILRYPPAWNLLPGRLSWHARNRVREWHGRFVYWKASRGW